MLLGNDTHIIVMRLRSAPQRRYIADRFLLDIAIDLIDEAAAVEDVTPASLCLDELDRRLVQLSEDSAGPRLPRRDKAAAQRLSGLDQESRCLKGKSKLTTSGRVSVMRRLRLTDIKKRCAATCK
jgi:ATP-dependent Clp protease ATP-binding subunit ClpA